MHALLVEDDELLAEGLKVKLNKQGFPTDWASTGKQAQTVVLESPPDIVILDLGLPDMDGISFLSWLRGHFEKLPVLILTARDAIEDKINGLDRGADDYLVKPFNTDELCARLRVLERRYNKEQSKTFQNGSLSLNSEQETITLDGKSLEVSYREYLLLRHLMQNLGAVQSRKSLETQLYQWGDSVQSNAIDVHIHNLRKKIGNQTIKTIRGVGYVMHKM